MKPTRLIMVFVAATATAAAAQPPTVPTAVKGYRATVQTTGPSADKWAGEILAVEQDSLWLLQSGEVVGVPLVGVESIRIRQHGLGPGQALGWSLAGGIISGLLLTAACSSVEDTSGCGSVFVGAMVVWMTIGLISSATLHEATVKLRPPLTDSYLRRYARYPQGRPANLPTSTSSPRLNLGLRLPLPFPN